MLTRRIAAIASTAVAAAGLATANAGVAHAQSPPPIGYWSNASGSSNLLIDASGVCSLADGYGVPTTSGPCSWNGTYAGGILTIISSQTFYPSPVYFNVIWVDNNTISVEGDYYFKQ